MNMNTSKTNLIERSLIGLLVVLNALFLYYWVALAANYCLHYDDVHFLWKMREYSIFDYVHEMYMTRGGNFVSYGLNGIIFTIANWIGGYRAWAMIFYVLGIVITWSAFRDLPWLKKEGFKGWLGVITLYNVYVLTSVDYAVFTWICAMEYYLFAPVVCLIIRYLNQETLKWWQWILLVVCAIFISGNAVSISTITFVILFAYGMFLWYKENWNISETWKKPQIRRLLAITALMLICFTIVFVAPGNWSRMEGEFDIEQPQNLKEFLRAIIVCAGMFLYLMAFYFPYHLIAVALGAWVGTKYPMQLSCNRNKAIILTILVFVSYLLICVLPLAYLSNGFQIQRNYIQIGLFYLLTFFVIGYLITNNRKKDYSIFSQTSVGVCALFLIVIMCLNTKQDLPVARAYNLAHQERETCLKSLQEAGQKETVLVEPFPSTHTPDAKYNVLKWLGKSTTMPSIYYESDTGTDPNEYENHIRKLLKLDFDFVLAEPQE
jgi:hypothetical protein